jgi:hypothetical protein
MADSCLKFDNLRVSDYGKQFGEVFISGAYLPGSGHLFYELSGHYCRLVYRG